jgi:nucleoside phosphorylase
METTRSHDAAPLTPASSGAGVDIHDIILNYDPEQPSPRFKAAGLAAAAMSTSDRLPSAVPWPAGTAPVAAPLSKAPSEDADLTAFKGYDAIVMTWTSAETAALASLFTPDFLPSKWYEYRHGVEAYVPLVTGQRSPFNDQRATMERYFHSLGLYFPCRVGNARVLLFKSGLHLDYDGPALPVRKLVAELLAVVQPKMLITTGTGGGIGKDVALGDVVIAALTRFDCATQFKDEPFRDASYDTSPLPAGTLAAITPALTSVNAKRVTGGRPVPKIWSAATDAIVTTDFFGFDDSTDHFKLQGKGRVCDMGDAMVGQVASARHGLRWYAIRNASDPQIPNPDHDIDAANTKAGEIYSRFGAFTTAASVVATWAVIHSAFNGHTS